MLKYPVLTRDVPKGNTPDRAKVVALQALAFLVLLLARPLSVALAATNTPRLDNSVPELRNFIKRKRKYLHLFAGLRRS